MPGSIRRRGKYWEIRLDDIPDPVTGRRRQISRSVKGPKHEAQAVLGRLLHERGQGIDLRPERVSVGDYLKRWLRSYAERNLAPKTVRRYRELVRLHIVPSIGKIVLAKLRPLYIQGVYDEMLDKGLSARTVIQAHRVLREALQHAVEWQLLTLNPAAAVHPPRAPRRDGPNFDVEVVRAVLDAAEASPYGVIVQTATYTGLRQGELLGLRWQDVDLDGGDLRVRQVCQWLPGQGFIFCQPKTHRSVRPVALSPVTLDILRRHRAHQVEARLTVGAFYDDHDLVFASPTGRPLPPSTLRGAWLRICAAAGVCLRFHDLRHIHASLLMAQGVHPKVASERLGHSAVGITLDTYSHVAPSLQESAARQIDRALGWTVSKP